MLKGAWHFSLFEKTALTLLLLAPLGFVMGMPFPLGLRRLHEKQSTHLPWAWGINGCLSVISPALAMMVAVESGFIAVFALAGGAYLLAMAVNLR